MSIIDYWQDVNRMLIPILDTLCERLLLKSTFDSSAKITRVFVFKAGCTLKGVTILYEHDLPEQAQALVRILLELRLNFDCFIQMFKKDPKAVCLRVIDSMMLEKIKQQRTSDFSGLDSIPDAPSPRDFEDAEREIVSRYSAQELNRLKKYGFTGVSIEERAKLSGNEELYNIIYRNFSRNIHSTDFMEILLEHEPQSLRKFPNYYEVRDGISLQAAHFSAGGIAESSNGVYDCGLDLELERIGRKYHAILESQDN